MTYRPDYQARYAREVRRPRMYGNPPAPWVGPHGGPTKLNAEQYAWVKAQADAGASAADIAVALGVKYTTVRNALRRGLKRFEREARDEVRAVVRVLCECVDEARAQP